MLTAFVDTVQQARALFFVSFFSTTAIKMLLSVAFEILEGTAKTNRSSESIISPFSIFFTTSADSSPSVLSPDVKVAMAVGGRIINQIFASLPCSLLHCPLLIDIQFVDMI